MKKKVHFRFSERGLSGMIITERANYSIKKINSHKKLLTAIRSYLKFDQKLSDEQLQSTMNILKKESFATLMQKYELNEQFLNRYKLLRYIKSFLMRYKNID